MKKDFEKSFEFVFMTQQEFANKKNISYSMVRRLVLEILPDRKKYTILTPKEVRKLCSVLG